MRAMAIVLVVIGHVIGGLAPLESTSPGDQQTMNQIYRFIYTFHMPAFWFLAGLFAVPSLLKSKTGPFVFQKVCTLLYPYIVWGMITWLCHAVMQRYTNSSFNPRVPYLLLIDPAAGPWFLYTLFQLMVILALVGRTLLGRIVMVLIFAVLHVLQSFIRLESVPNLFQVLAHHGLWFALGVLAYKIVRGTPSIPTATALFLGPALLLLTSSVGWLVAPSVLQSIVMAVSGTGGLFFLSVAVSRFTSWRPLLAVGQSTLEIFVLHGILTVGLRIVLVKFLKLTNPWILAVLLTTVGVAVPTVIAMASRKRMLAWMFRVVLKNKASADS
jgi:fucose 4-O-acetylase-like acetyltransferase